MRQRHWVRMSEIVGFDMTPDAGTTLRKMLKLNLYPHLPQFEEVSVGATKVMTCSFFYCVGNYSFHHVMIAATFDEYSFCLFVACSG